MEEIVVIQKRGMKGQVYIFLWKGFKITAWEQEEDDNFLFLTYVMKLDLKELLILKYVNLGAGEIA